MGWRGWGVSWWRLGEALVLIAVGAFTIFASAQWSAWWLIGTGVVLVVGVILMVVQRGNDDDDKPVAPPGPTATSGGVISINQSDGITAGTVNVGPPPPTIQGRATATNEEDDEGNFHNRMELQIVSQRPASGLELAVHAPGLVGLQVKPGPPGGMIQMTSEIGAQGARATIQNPPPHGRVVVDLVSTEPLTSPVELNARAW